MIKRDYTALDAAILDQIDIGRGTAMQLVIRLESMVREMTADEPREPAVFRFIDRRLQALRKKHQIQHDGRRWHVVKKP